MTPEEHAHITVPLDNWVVEIVDLAVEKHLNRCPVRERVARLELKFATLVGCMIGSGLLGGVAGSVLSGLLPGK